MFRKTSLIALATLLTVGLSITDAEAGKRSGGGGGGSKGFSRSGGSMRSGGMKSSSKAGKPSQFRSLPANIGGGVSQQNLARQFQSKAKTNFKPSALAATRTTAPPQLKHFQQKVTHHVAAKVQHHVKNHVLHHAGTFKCGPIRVCHKPGYYHCRKPWLDYWVQPCVRPFVITCPIAQPVPVLLPAAPLDPAAPAEPVAPEAPRPEVMAGTQISLDGVGFGNDAGQIRLNIAGLALVAPIVDWNDNGVTVAIPPMDLAGPADAELVILHADGATLQTMEVLIVPTAS